MSDTYQKGYQDAVDIAVSIAEAEEKFCLSRGEPGVNASRRIKQRIQALKKERQG